MTTTTTLNSVSDLSETQHVQFNTRSSSHFFAGYLLYHLIPMQMLLGVKFIHGTYILTLDDVNY